MLIINILLSVFSCYENLEFILCNYNRGDAIFVIDKISESVETGAVMVLNISLDQT